jgi:hypothetical protein
MAYEIKVDACQLIPGEQMISARYSDVSSMLPEYILHEIVSLIASKYVELHYVEIEALIDPKVVAACVSSEMGALIEERFKSEIRRVNEVAGEALRHAKRAGR